MLANLFFIQVVGLMYLHHRSVRHLDKYA